MPKLLESYDSGRSVLSLLSIPIHCFTVQFDRLGECHHSLRALRPMCSLPYMVSYPFLPSLKKGQQIHGLDPLSQLSTNFEIGTFSYLMCMVEQFPGLWAGRHSLTQSKPTGHGMSEWYYDLELYN